MQQPSAAKQRVIDFVTKTKLEEDYEFWYEGSKKNAEKFVHRMRVELSRLRKLVKAKGRPTALFKVLIVEMEEVGEDDDVRTRVVLRKSGSALVEVDESLSDALNAIERGAR